MRPDFFHFVVDDIIDAAVRFEFGHGGVGRRQVEPLGAGLKVGLPEIKTCVRTMADADQRGVGVRLFLNVAP